MKRLVQGWRAFNALWLALACLAPGFAWADSTAAFTRGLLWKIERTSGSAKPSFVFGTIHSDDPQVATPPQPVAAALAGSRIFMMEMLPDAQALITVAQAMLGGEGTSLKAAIGPTHFSKAVKALSERGMPEPLVDRMAPWAAAVALNMPKPRGELPLDLALYAATQTQNKPALGIETAAEQTAVFSSLSSAEQIALLKETIDNLPQIEQAFGELHRVYLTRDLAAIVKLSERYAPRDQALARKMMSALLDTRNLRMVQRIEAELQKGGAFVAIGALHLPGEKGVLQLLHARGYRVTSVY